jgi:hypothetical protein
MYKDTPARLFPAKGVFPELFLRFRDLVQRGVLAFDITCYVDVILVLG